MITFSIDTMPLSTNCLSSNDYSSKVIYSAIADTLFKYDLKSKTIVKNACQYYKYTKNRKNLIIKIRDDLYFNDGTKVMALDYYNLFNEILSSNTHIGIIFKRFFLKVDIINQHTLKLSNRNRDNKSYEILSIYSTGCLKEQCTSGPYFISDRNEKYIILERNKFYRKKNKNNDSLKIKFVVTDGLNDYKSFDSKVQITNNTIADVNKIDKYKYISEENYIYLSILFSNKFMSRSYKFIRKKIFNSIDSEQISKILNFKYRKYQTFIVDDLNLKIKKPKTIETKEQGILLSIGYNNFYPNNIIAEEIKKQLEKKGFKVKLVKKLFDLNNRCDLNVVLNHIEYMSESALINGTFLAIILEKSLISRFYLRMYNTTHRKIWLNIINRKLLKLNYKIPLLQMKGYYMKNEKYCNFNYIELNYEDL